MQRMDLSSFVGHMFPGGIGCVSRLLLLSGSDFWGNTWEIRNSAKLFAGTTHVYASTSRTEVNILHIASGNPRTRLPTVAQTDVASLLVVDSVWYLQRECRRQLISR